MFKVGDKVVDAKSGYVLDSGTAVTTGVVTAVLDGGYIVLFDGLDTSLFCLISDVTTPQEPTPPRKMHPDDFMLAVSEFATDNGFGVTQLDFYGKEFIGAALPRHSYSV